MRYYSINLKGYVLAGCDSVQEFYFLRKRNLKITSVFWLTVRVDIDPRFVDCLNRSEIPILIFLN